ncbi:hypothetical protein L7F22_021443 [Adiantum nelumboides]|nr:hypothetical protein [Adiantum nelumboides]
MDLGSSSSSSKHLSSGSSAAMSGSFGSENNSIQGAEHGQTGAGGDSTAHAGAVSKQQQPLLGGIAKSNNNISSASAGATPGALNNVNTNNISLNRSNLSSLTHANLFTSARSDLNHSINIGSAQAPGAAVAADNLNLTKNCNTSSTISLSTGHNINNNSSNINNMTSGITNLTRTNSGGNITSSNISDRNNTSNSTVNGGVRYKECLKNHAANMGGYAVDGCGEFMPSGEEGSLEALKCAACGCHRNFHRREINGGGTTSNTMSLLALPSTINTSNNSATNSEYGEGDHNHCNATAIPAAGSGGGAGPYAGHYNAGHVGASLLPHLHHHHHHQYMQAWMGGKLLPPAGGGAAGHHGGMHVHHGGGAGAAGQYSYMGMGGGHHNIHAGVGGSGHAGGKRFRTKFTMEQREKMFEFSEKVGWRIHKHDEAAVQQFCAEAGVKRHVLKVWMHNNKNTFGKKLLRFPEAFNALPESSS